MKTTPNIKPVVYFLMLLLVAVILLCLAVCPADFMKAGLVYQGF